MSDPLNSAAPNGQAGHHTARPERRGMPGPIVAAVVILWIWFGFIAYFALLMVRYWIFGETGATWQFFLFPLTAGMAALVCLLAVKLRSGRRWARVLCIVLFSLDALGAVLLLRQLPEAPGMYLLHLLAALALLWLLNLPSAREWCSGPKPARSPHA